MVMTGDDSQLLAPGQRDAETRLRTTSLLDALLVEHRELASLMRSAPANAPWNGHYVARMKLLLARQEFGLRGILEGCPERSSVVREALRGHPLYSEYFMQAPLISAANGHDGGMLSANGTRIVLGRRIDGAPAYGEALNRLLLDLPLCEGLRDFGAGLTREMRAMAAGGRVLVVGEAAAAYVEAVPEAARSHLSVGTLEVNLAGLDTAMQTPALGSVSGQEPDTAGFDGIYVTALVSCRPCPGALSPGLEARLTHWLARQLRPGGTLAIASAFAGEAASLTLQPHWLLLDGETDLAERTRTEIEGFAKDLPVDSVTIALFAEDMVTPLDHRASLAALRVSI